MEIEAGAEGLPGGDLKLADLARLAYGIADRLIDRAEAAARSRGEKVTCAQGCAACCRQVIPVSPAEAFAIRELVGGLYPEGRRRVAARCASHRSVLAAAWEEGRLTPWDPEGYFSLHLDCPFLEGEACTVHPQRPLACREHLVVSPASHCASFPSAFIRPLDLPAPVGEALGLACADLLGRAPERIPLASALEWTEDHAEDGERAWPRETALAALYRRLGRGRIL